MGVFEDAVQAALQPLQVVQAAIQRQWDTLPDVEAVFEGKLVDNTQANRRLVADAVEQAAQERTALVQTLRDDHKALTYRLEQEHGVLGRRVAIIESQSAENQRAEVDALGRRVGAMEGLLSQLRGTVDADLAALGALRDQHESYVSNHGRFHDTTTAEENNRAAATRYELDTALRAQDARAALALATQWTGVDTRLLKWESWYAAQEAWDVMPWWKRVWRRLRGERP